MQLTQWLLIAILVIPLALVMVFLTTLTLWSLGQSIVVEPASTGTAPLTAVR